VMLAWIESRVIHQFRLKTALAQIG
jgi:hypothetical protein